MKSNKILPWTVVALCIAFFAIAGLFVRYMLKTEETYARLKAEPGVLETIATRASVRMFDKTRAVEEEKIKELLKAGFAAPTAVDKRPWEFVVVTEPETLAALDAVHPHARIGNGASLVIAVCGTLDNGLDGRAKEYWIQDCSAATQNILLAAHGLGLGAVWCGVHPIEERVAGVKRVLGIPEGYAPLNLITIGYPAVHPAPKNKWDDAKIHRNRW